MAICGNQENQVGSVPSPSSHGALALSPVKCGCEEVRPCDSLELLRKMMCSQCWAGCLAYGALPACTEVCKERQDAAHESVRHSANVITGEATLFPENADGFSDTISPP